MLNRVALLLAVVSVPLSAGPPGEPRSTNPDPYSPDRAHVQLDDDGARRFVDDFARCNASRDPRRAAASLALPYGSKEQGKVVDDLVSRHIDCWGAFSGTGMFSSDRTSLAAGLAEYFVINPKKIDDIRRRDPNSFVWVPPVGIEEFGQCVVSQNAAGVSTLVKSRVASQDENAAEDALSNDLAQCISEGQTLELDRTTLRQILAVSMYKHLAMPQPAAQEDAATPSAP